MHKNVKANSPGMQDLVKALKFMKENSVYVGVPEEDTDREENANVTNAELLFIHTNGSPVNNIPARPVIEPAIENDKERLSRMMRDAGRDALNGDKSAALEKLKRVGIRGQNIARAWFTNPANGWPPNAPSVAAAKIRKGSTEPRPLIDTGELRKSITYVIKK